MAFHMSVAEAREALSRARNAMAKVREQAEEAIGHGIEVAEVGGAAFGFGYANGRWGEDGEVKILGLPLDLGAGIALTGVAMLGGLGLYTEHGINVGAGAIAAYAYRTGYQLGQSGASDSEEMRMRQMPYRHAPSRMAAPSQHVATAGEWAPRANGQAYTVVEHHQGDAT
jgi:hypothetical protein